MIDYSNIPNRLTRPSTSTTPPGTQICTGTSTAICSYNKSLTYTALLITVTTSSDTYHLVRRDVSATAKCATRPPPSRRPLHHARPDLGPGHACYRVTGATTDDLWFSVRALGSAALRQYPPGAVLQVANAAGAIVCRQWGTARCRVSGSTSYQLIVTADNYVGVAITTHLDAWRVATASGWAAQCTSHTLNASGNWGPVRLTLTEQATGYCALVHGLQPDQSFGIFGTDSAPFQDMPFLNIYTNWDWTQTFIDGVCSQGNVGQFGFGCGTNEEPNPSRGIMLVAPGSAQSPTAVAMWGGLRFPVHRPHPDVDPHVGQPGIPARRRQHDRHHGHEPDDGHPVPVAGQLGAGGDRHNGVGQCRWHEAHAPA